MLRDFVVEVVLEGAFLTASIPLVEDCLDLLGDILLALKMLVEIKK